MAYARSLTSWSFGKVVSVLVVFAILWLGTLVAGKLQELKEADQTINQLQSIEVGLRDVAARSVTEAQARVKEFDKAAQGVVEERVRELDEEIKRVSSQLPSPAQRTIAVAKGDIKKISEWASNEVTVHAWREEREALTRILKYRSDLGEYQRSMREGHSKLARLRSEHIAILNELSRLEMEIYQLKMDHPILIRVPGSSEEKRLESLEADHRAKVKRTHDLREMHDRSLGELQLIEKAKHPGDLFKEPNIGPVYDELRAAWGKYEAQLKADWLWHLIHTDVNAQRLFGMAVAIVAGTVFFRLVIKLIFYFLLAPIVSRRPGVALLPDSGGRVLTSADFLGRKLARTSSVSCQVAVDSSSELLVHSEYLQSLPNECETQTQWLLKWRIPLSTLAAGLFGLTNIRTKNPQTVVVSSTRDPLSEVALITIPDGSSVVLLPRHIVAVLQRVEEPLRITRHWRLFVLHAWLTLQLRYLVFHGPVSLVVKGCRGVRVETANGGRRLNPEATMGFSANLQYSSRRCETFFSYWSGKQPLLFDSFAGGSGYYIYQEVPYQRRGDFFGRGLEGLLDAVREPLGI